MIGSKGIEILATGYEFGETSAKTSQAVIIVHNRCIKSR